MSPTLLGPEAPVTPELGAREDETGFELRLRIRLVEAVECSAEVVLLAFEPVELLLRQALEEPAEVLLRAGEEVVGVAAADVFVRRRARASRSAANSRIVSSIQ